MAAKVEFGQLSEFRHGVDTVDDYMDRFELYTVANDITDDEKKRAVFLTSVGATTYAFMPGSQYSSRRVVSRQRRPFPTRRAGIGKILSNTSRRVGNGLL